MATSDTTPCSCRVPAISASEHCQGSPTAVDLLARRWFFGMWLLHPCLPSWWYYARAYYYLPKVLQYLFLHARAHTHTHTHLRGRAQADLLSRQLAGQSPSLWWLDYRRSARSVVGGPGTATVNNREGSNVLCPLASDRRRRAWRRTRGRGSCRNQLANRGDAIL